MKHFLQVLGALGEWLFEDVSARHEVKIISSPFPRKWFVVTLQGQILKQTYSRTTARHWAIANRCVIQPEKTVTICPTYSAKTWLVLDGDRILKQENSRDEAQQWAIAEGYQIKN